MRYLQLPGMALTPDACEPAYRDYLREWREGAIRDADAGEIASSICLQAALIDLVLFGAVKHDWLGLMDAFLLADGRPIAYSEAFGARLYGFDAQYRQNTIHAIHTRWWIENVCVPEAVDHGKFAHLILEKMQTDGLIYDRDVSPTILRHRMKSELTMSAAMAAEILDAAGALEDELALRLATSLVDPKKCPQLGYMGMEYFRLVALRSLRHEELFPVGISVPIVACADGLEFGWCDFAMRGKIDAYMGTAKRTARDKPIHSPLTACHVLALIPKIEAEADRQAALDRFAAYAKHMEAAPMDIPAFQMRDVPIPFGADRTPIEVICASHMIISARKK